jgi:hypothetical protein
MTTLDRLERYEGHLLNWYDTRTLAPLEPRYISTADSGNLLACLWVLEQGCQDTLRAPVLGHQSLLGLADTLSVLREACDSDPLTAVHMSALRRLLRGKSEGYAVIGRLRLALAPIQQLREMDAVRRSAIGRRVSSRVAILDRNGGSLPKMDGDSDARRRQPCASWRAGRPIAAPPCARFLR